MNQTSHTFLKLFLLFILCAFPQFVNAEENLTGTLKLRIIDMSDGSHQVLRFIIYNNKQIKLAFPFHSEQELKRVLYRSGIKIQISGYYKSESEFEVTSFKVFGDDRIDSLAAITGSRKMLIIMINFSGKSQTCSPAQIDSIVYTGEKSVQKQLEVSSKNQFTIIRDTNGDGHADIVGPYLVNESAGSCNNPDGWATVAKAAAQAAGVNLALYKHIFYSMPSYELLNCSYAGLADLGCSGLCEGWMLDCTTRNTWSHEFGHNLGMEHAATDTNNDGILEEEYGDYSCPMGSPYEDIQFNAVHQDQMGWFDAFSGKKTIISTSGAFSLVALETNPGDASQPMTILIQKGTNDYYYLSYRSSLGLFNQIDDTYRGKINIHRYAPNSSSSHKTRFIKSLSTGESWTDSAMNMRICAGATSQTHANLGLAFNGAACSADNPGNPPAPDTPTPTPTPTPPPTAQLPNDEFGPDDDSITPLPGDTDGDGVSNVQEALDGTSSNDPGSYFSRLTSPTYTLWNGFLSMINIMELINPGTSSSMTVHLSLYNINGNLEYSQNIPLNPGEQRDIIINQLPGFSADSYGIIKLEYSSPLSGRMSFYKGSANQYEFAYSVPLDRSTKGNSILGFNTYQPSTKSTESSYQVFNWLTLVNLENSPKNFTVRTYNQLGTRIASRIINIPAFGRTDIDGGHGLLGPNNVGLHQVRPEDPDGKYIAQIIRYGSKANPGQAASSYAFAFPISSRSGNGEVQVIPISRQFKEANWLELLNARNTTVPVTVNFYYDNGLSAQKSYSLQPFSQTHIAIDDTILFENERGYASINPSGSHSIVAQSMSYHRDSSGSIEGMFGITSRQALGNSFTGSFNLYLGMDNWLALSNTSNSSLSVAISSSSISGNGSTTISIPAQGTRSINVKSTSSLLANANTYGSLRILPERQNSLSADLVRIRPEGNGVDFAFPTEVRGEIP
ncbi:MAG TPA: M66 family metalloprotease [Oligoflexia bacterium]|nr:M66 family metalloprotease [Oligoflexia bacterium]HMP49408.1 M66 family metalloprotease [Oligoflexia bacterium]